MAPHSMQHPPNDWGHMYSIIITLPCCTEILVVRWVLSMAPVKASSGWTIYVVMDQRQTLLSVKAWSGDNTTVNIMKMFPSLVAEQLVSSFTELFLVTGIWSFCIVVFYELNSGRRPWSKLIRSASLQRVFDVAIAKLLWRLVCRCFYMSICVFFYDNVELKRMGQNVYRQSPDGDKERFFGCL